MEKPTVMSILGVLLAFVIVVLGIIAISTPTWLIIKDVSRIEKVYSLFERCDQISYLTIETNKCEKLDRFSLPQIFNIVGIVILGVGNLLAIGLALLTNNTLIQSVSQLFLLSGPTFLLLGSLFFVQHVLDNYTARTVELNLGYSFICLMIMTILGYISSVYFMFSTFSHREMQRNRVVAIS